MPARIGRSTLFYWSLIFGAMQALDLYLTAALLHWDPNGEVNPIARRLLHLHGFPLMVIYKAIGVSIVLVATFILNRYAPSRRAMVYALWGFTLTVAFTDVWNLAQFARMH